MPAPSKEPRMSTVLLELFRGGNFGKLVLQVATE
jgi:NADPH-dependent curcumin reductase CurA